MIRRILVLILVFAFVFDSSLSFAAGSLSLNSLVNEARQNNPEILAAKKKYEAAKARIPQAKSLDDPVLGLDFQKTPGSPFQFNKTPSEERMLSITQALPFFGKLPLKGKIALVESQMYAAGYKDKELEIVNQLKNAYYDLFLNYKEISLDSDSLSLLEGIVKVAQAKYSLGQLSQEAVFKIQGEVASLSNKIVNLKQELDAKKTRINTILNRDPESPLEEPALIEDISFNQDLNSLYRFTLENQPQLLVFSYAIEKNKYAKSLAKRSFFPDFMARLTERGITTGTIGPWDLMLAFTVPLWFWTKQRYEVKEAIANLEEAQASYQAMKNSALAQTKNLYTRIEVSRSRINMYKTGLIPILEGSVESSLAAFRSGKGDFMALLDTQRMLIEARMDYYRALAEYNMNLADLERAVGTDFSEVKK